MHIEGIIMVNATYMPVSTADSAPISYTKNYSGGIQLLKDSGFSPYKYNSGSPLDSTLYQVLNKFVEKTGIQTDTSALKDSFLEANPDVEKAVNLYSSLEQTFSLQKYRDKTAIMDFLDQQINSFFLERNTDDENSLTRTEAGIPTPIFLDIDANGDWKINKNEMKENLYGDFKELNNIIQFFEGNPGTLVDTYS